MNVNPLSKSCQSLVNEKLTGQCFSSILPQVERDVNVIDLQSSSGFKSRKFHFFTDSLTDYSFIKCLNPNDITNLPTVYPWILENNVKQRIFAPCGKCHFCLEKRSRDWATLIDLEANSNLGKSLFVTLTFDDEHLPEDGKVSNEFHVNFFKRMRRDIDRRLEKVPGYLKRRIKYFIASEYGDRTNRLHYHMILFGLTLNEANDLVRKNWKNGVIIDIRSIRKGSAKYVTKYISKQSALGKNRYFYSQRLGLGYIKSRITDFIRNPYFSSDKISDRCLYPKRVLKHVFSKEALLALYRKFMRKRHKELYFNYLNSGKLVRDFHRDFCSGLFQKSLNDQARLTVKS